MNKCLGCGAYLQSHDSSLEGYTTDLNNKFCKRCFDITHYNKYVSLNKNNDVYLKKINYINKSNDLVVLTLDLFNLFDLDSLKLTNPIILAFTKKDLVSRSIHENKIFEKIDCHLNIVAKIFVSSKNNYNLDLLIDLINKYKTSKNVYFVGLTNAGKSSLINKILKNYFSVQDFITVSNLPSTTLDFICKKVSDDLILIDTPGLIDDGSIVNVIGNDYLKKIVPNKEINPIIYQIKCSQSIIIEDFLKLNIFSNNNLIFYVSNNLKIERIYKSNNKLEKLKKYVVELSNNQDLVIKGLGFVKFKNGCKIELFLPDGVSYLVRNSIV